MSGVVHVGRVGRRVVLIAWDGGDIVSDGGGMLLRQIHQRIGLTRAAAGGPELLDKDFHAMTRP